MVETLKLVEPIESFATGDGLGALVAKIGFRPKSKKVLTILDFGLK
jgi:hypothetical protein